MRFFYNREKKIFFWNLKKFLKKIFFEKIIFINPNLILIVCKKKFSNIITRTKVMNFLKKGIENVATAVIFRILNFFKKPKLYFFYNTKRNKCAKFRQNRGPTCKKWSVSHGIDVILQGMFLAWDGEIVFQHFPDRFTECHLITCWYVELWCTCIKSYILVVHLIFLRNWHLWGPVGAIGLFRLDTVLTCQTINFL